MFLFLFFRSYEIGSFSQHFGIDIYVFSNLLYSSWKLYKWQFFFLLKCCKSICKLSTKHSKRDFSSKCRFSIHLSFECKSTSHPLHISDCTFKYHHISNIYLYTESQEMHIHISMHSIIFLIFLLLFFFGWYFFKHQIDRKKLLHKSIIYHNFFVPLFFFLPHNK